MPLLTQADIEFLLEALKYTKAKFQATEYPSYEFRQQQIQRVEDIQAKLRALRDSPSDA